MSRHSRFFRVLTPTSPEHTPSASPTTFKRTRNRVHLALDTLLLVMSVVVAYTLRFEGLSWIEPYGANALWYMVATIPMRLAFFYSVGMYRRLWHLASVVEMERVLLAGLLSAVASSVTGAFILPMVGAIPSRIPLGVLAIDALVVGAAIAVPRFAQRLRWWRRQRNSARAGRRALIVGAGEAGQLAVRSMLASPRLGMLPVAFVDDDVSKHGHRIHDIPVLGPISSIASVLEIHAISEVVVAMPSVTGDVVRGVVRAALDAGITARTVPALQDILTGNVSVTQFREIQIEDLLRRTPIQTDLEAVGALVSNRVVMVTGAGGSIGSELCRQVARLSPSRLVLLGHGENSIFEITEELGHSQPDAPIEAVIADVRDRDRIQQVFDRIRPDVVFHAAAHKHVPLMEANVIEAITNNIVGTLNVVRSAASVGTQNFVLISSDKAVQPTSVMGATKRVAEQVVQLEAERSGLAFVAVRFGNVLGSRGSVVPTFLRQIRAGGPVKVTHPEMTRYFMTIPEAVQLVLQAGALGMGGEVFVLDMGEPVRIVDLARDLIRLSGLREDVDVKIQFTGPRPGEKLFEEVFLSEEEVSHTQHPKVLRVRHAEVRPGTEERVAQIARVAQQHGSDTQIRALLTELVPAYAPPSWERRTAETASTNGSNGAKPTLSVEFTPHLIDAACEDNAVPAPAGDRRAS